MTMYESEQAMVCSDTFLCGRHRCRVVNFAELIDLGQKIALYGR